MTTTPRRFPPSVRAALTGDPRDERVAALAERVTWLPRGRPHQGQRARLSLSRSCMTIPRTVLELLPAGTTRLQVGLLGGRLVLRPADQEQQAYALQHSRKGYGAKVGTTSLGARLRAAGVPVPSKWAARWVEDLGWLECVREEAGVQ